MFGWYKKSFLTLLSSQRKQTQKKTMQYKSRGSSRAFDADKFQFILRCVSVIEKEFFPLIDVFLSVDSDSVITIHHHHFGAAVGAPGMVCKPDQITFSRSVNCLFWKQTISAVARKVGGGGGR